MTTKSSDNPKSDNAAASASTKLSNRTGACVKGSKSLNNGRLTDRHYEECVTNRGLNSEWIEVNCRSMDQKEASSRLGYSAQSAGIWLEGTNGFGQFRPNKPWKSKEERKAPKYRTATGETYDAMLPRHPHNREYWEDLVALKELCWKINGHPCLGITEGLFKAIAACFIEIPCVALAGVEQGLTSGKDDPQGKRYLVETLEKLALEGFGFIILFDADAATKEGVVKAQYKLAAQLVKFNVPVYIGTGLWSEEEGKGMDDYIKNHGADQFKRSVMGKVVDFSAWERQFYGDNQKDGKITQDNFAQLLAERYRAKLAWNVEAKAWYWYEALSKAGVWGEIPIEEVIDIVTTALEERTDDFSSNFVMGTINLLKGKLRVNQWQVIPELVCLEDGVVNIHTLKFGEHEPGYRFLSRLPFKWSDREIGCEPIKQWLLETCGGRQEWVEVLRAGMNATLTERGGELQRYMELIGAGGTGKGTILRLMQALLGKENYAITTLKQLEQNRFETAMFYHKKAIFITDSERYAGEVSTLKALTGDDAIRIEKKGVQQTGSFQFLGMVWLGANEAMQSVDYSNALPRRRVSMSFDKVIPPHQRRDLNEEFKPYLPGFLFWVLSMDTAEVSDYLRNTVKRVPSLGLFSTEVLLDTNPLANWADQCLYYDPKIESKIGDSTGDANYCLYANYCRWALANGQGTMTTQRFSNILLNLLKTQLGIDAIKRKTNKGRFITCIGIRQPGHDFPLLLSGAGDNSVMTQVKGSETTPVTAQTIGNDDVEQSEDLKVESQNLQPPITTSCLHSEKASTPGHGSHSDPNPSDEKGSGHHELVVEASLKQEQVVTNELQPLKPSTNKNASSIDRDDVELTLAQKIIRNWDNSYILGKVVLAADTEQLKQEVRNYDASQLKWIKEAANQAWKPGCDSFGEYCGEKVELIKFDTTRNWKVRTASGNAISVARGNVRPWLGI